MEPSEACFNLIKKWEGLHRKWEGLHRRRPDGLIEAYQDPVGIWTIGYGSIYNPDENRPVREGDTITVETALRWLRLEVKEKAERVDELCKVALKQPMFDALVSFAYNVGIGNKGFKGSTLLRKLNERDFEGAAREFDRWVRAGGSVLQGLINRRNDEEALFRRDDWPTDRGGGAVIDEGDQAVVDRPYRPAPLPLPITRTQREGHVGDDCYVLNCALAGLGFLAQGSQPNKFTSFTEDAVTAFQFRMGLSVDGVVGKDTRRALEQALESARK